MSCASGKRSTVLVAALSAGAAASSARASINRLSRAGTGAGSEARRANPREVLLYPCGRAATFRDDWPRREPPPRLMPGQGSQRRQSPEKSMARKGSRDNRPARSLARSVSDSESDLRAPPTSRPVLSQTRLSGVQQILPRVMIECRPAFEIAGRATHENRKDVAAGVGRRARPDQLADPRCRLVGAAAPQPAAARRAGRARAGRRAHRRAGSTAAQMRVGGRCALHHRPRLPPRQPRAGGQRRHASMCWRRRPRRRPRPPRPSRLLRQLADPEGSAALQSKRMDKAVGP